MTDRISTYRQARLVLQIPTNPASPTYYSVHLVGVKGGIPTSNIVVDGYVGNLPQQATVEEVLEAMHAAVRGCMLT